MEILMFIGLSRRNKKSHLEGDSNAETEPQRITALSRQKLASLNRFCLSFDTMAPNKTSRTGKTAH